MDSIETLGEDVLGEDVLGADDDVGARRVLSRPKSRMLRLPPRPQWRSQLAPGVPMPGQGRELLPLTPSANNGVFTAAVTSITFSARPQAPFRAERMLTTVRRSGAAGTIILGQSIFVGRSLQLVELGSFDIEQFGPAGLDLSMYLVPAEPGVLIQIPCIANPAPAGADTVAVAIAFLGRTIR